MPNNKLVNLIINLKPNELINSGDDLIAFYSKENQDEVDLESFKKIDFDEKVLQINNLTDIFKINIILAFFRIKGYQIITRINQFIWFKIDY